MSTFDKILHTVGLLAGGIVAVGASGGVALPAWLMVVAGIVAPVASGAAAAPAFMKKTDKPS